MAGQGRDEPVTVEICAELAALGVADPRQAIRSRREKMRQCPVPDKSAWSGGQHLRGPD